ncbi:hypothetical protein, partial [Orrella sp. 11846]|uniref:hypothetical protein n=1 Tax=Orrella sp. 11846 TaxID=3409913 RepID=UPI003B5C091D
NHTVTPHIGHTELFRVSSIWSRQMVAEVRPYRAWRGRIAPKKRNSSLNQAKVSLILIKKVILINFP